ncbi:hypothetical protein [Streptomyces iakyrus]|uniref:hypothetical protein n=1 Tax=Streptomyces iakyrus TaxID=68219 RepID=UPI003D89E706
MDVVGEGLVAGFAVGDLLEQVPRVVVVGDGGFGLAGGVDAVLGALGPAEQVVLGDSGLAGSAGGLLQEPGRVVFEQRLRAERVGGRLGAIGLVVVPLGGVQTGVRQGGEVAVLVVAERGGVPQRVGDLPGLVERVEQDRGL